MPASTPQPFTFQLSADTTRTIRDVLIARGCTPYDPHTHTHCDLHWTTKQRTLTPAAHAHCRSHTPVTSPACGEPVAAALLNHFPHTANVTQKDALARTMRRLRAVYGGRLYGFTPLSFILPREKAAWYEAARKDREEERRQQDEDSVDGQQLWIVKPSLSSQGRNIALITDPASHVVSSNPAVCQRYIGRPHLINGHKYDLRIYVLVTSCRPLRAYLCRQGLCRFSSQPYTPLDTSNLLAHLTNSALHKRSTAFRTKWTLAQYLTHAYRCPAALQAFWRRLTHLTLLTLLPLVADVGSQPGVSGSFELFGMDVLVDGSGRLWLLEVNKSPGIALCGDEDRLVKLPMLADLLDVIGVPRQAPAAAAVAVAVEARRDEEKEQLSFGVDTAAPLYGRRRASLSQRASPLHSRQSSAGGDAQKGALKDVGCWHAVWPSTEREVQLNDSVSDERMKADKQPALLLSRYQQAIVDTVKQQKILYRRQSLSAKDT